MWDITAMLIIAFLAVFGVLYWAQIIKTRLLEQGDRELYLLLPCGAQCEDLEVRIHAARHTLRQFNTAQPKYILILDNGMDETMRALALEAAAENENILILTANELKKLS